MSSPLHSSFSRRDFIKASAAFAGVTILPRSVFGANERLNYAIIGVGGIGDSAVRACSAMGNIVAFCDVDEVSAGRFYREFPSIPTFRDFRVMMDKLGKGIDAVAINTPDHSHHYITKYCMNAGKHVYTQKPLCNYISQVRELVDLAENTNVITQMGGQGHSTRGTHTIKAWYDAGLFGDVTDVYGWTNRPIWPQGMQAWPDQKPVPATMDWDLWHGPVDVNAYSDRVAPFNWRGYHPYGTGALGDMAVHIMDASNFALGYTWPEKIEVVMLDGMSEIAYPNQTQIVFHFPKVGHRPAVKFHWYDGEANLAPRPADLEEGRSMGEAIGGQYWVGSKATALAGTYGNSPRFIPEVKRREILPGAPVVERPSEHFQNWENAIKGTEEARSHFGYAGPFTEIVLLGVIAQRVGKTLLLDPTNKKILNSPEAEALMQAPVPRPEWDLS
jgi:predicted dehydrogenase